MKKRSKFPNVAVAGITFQAGSAAVDSATIMSALVYQLTGSPIVVGAMTAILRVGWLFPQLIIGFLAQRSGSSMQYYVVGAFGRATCLALLALALFVGSDWSRIVLAIAVVVLWTAYAFISGIVAVPYNDIVARSVPSEQRSGLLAIRFFGGGILALGVAAIADRLVGAMAFPASYAALLAMASCLMFVSSGVFTAMGEPEAKGIETDKSTFFRYIKKGRMVFWTDKRFRLFVYAQWCGSAVLMAMPFYIVQANATGFDLERVALLLGAQTAGALASNLLWGWWGDRLGKCSLLRAIAIGRVFPLAAILLLAVTQTIPDEFVFYAFVVLFFVLGALANGLTIAVIGFLMEISPDDRRPAYSGYFNAITAPAFLLPLLAGVIAAVSGLVAVFVISLIAAILQSTILLLIDVPPPETPTRLQQGHL
jgi:MFS family permease